MVQPATLTEREAAGGQKNSALTLTAMFSPDAVTPADCEVGVVYEADAHASCYC